MHTCCLSPAGSIYEYTLELASQTSAPSLEKHTAKLASVVAAQAEELRRQHSKDRLPVPGARARWCGCFFCVTTALEAVHDKTVCV